MKLVFLVANQAWVFTFGDSLVAMSDTRFFQTRDEAVKAAESVGLSVDKAGNVKMKEIA